MADSTYVFESGDPIQVGSHGETSYLYESGSPVRNDGESSVVFESGTGLGGAGNALLYDYGGGDSSNFGDMTVMKAEIESVIGAAVDTVVGTNLSAELTSKDYELVGIFTTENQISSLSSSDKTELSNWWSGPPATGLLVGTENTGQTGQGRPVLANDILDATLGVTPYNTNGGDSYWWDRYEDRVYTGSSGAPGCTGNFPTTLMPPLNGISSAISFASEGATTDPPTSESVFYWDDPSFGPRVWVDGSYTRYGDAHATACSDSRKYVTQTFEWLDRQI